MTHLNPQKELSLANEREENEQVAAAARAYLRRAGLSQRQFSARINYSTVALSLFMNGRYHQTGASARNIRGAVELFMQQNPLAPPTEVSGEMYETANVRLIEKTFERLLPKGAGEEPGETILKNLRALSSGEGSIAELAIGRRMR
jgi:transcriptional regulator with XRE-family HTH domain